MSEARIEDYLRRVRAGLASLPETVREDVVAELRSHIADRVEAGHEPAAVIAALGAPEDYAARMYDAHQVTEALSTRRTGALVGALIRSMAVNGFAIAAAIALFFLWSFVVSVAGVAVWEITDPEHTGLWVSDRVFFIGKIDDPSIANDVLGVWIFPLTLGLVAGAWLLTQALAVWTLRRLKRQT